MTQTKTAVFTGGGTGGHIYPNLALIPDIKDAGLSPVYIGGKGDTLERELCQKRNIPYFGVSTIKLRRDISFDSLKNNLAIPQKLRRGINEAKAVLENLSPKFIFSKGGFVSLPVVIAAKKLGVPIFAHESDRTLGLANKLAKLYGATILKGNPTSTFKGEFVGIPLRRELFCANRETAIKNLGISNKNNKKTLLVMGGSSGAQIFNDFVKENLENLTNDYFVLHLTGKGKGQKSSHSNYLAFEYAENVADFYAASDIVLSRAGATALFEISTLKKRAVFVPLPKGASRGDQLFNGELAKEYGAFRVEQTADLSTFFAELKKNVDLAEKNPPMRTIANDTNGKILEYIFANLHS